MTHSGQPPATTADADTAVTIRGGGCNGGRGHPSDSADASPAAAAGSDKLKALSKEASVAPWWPTLAGSASAAAVQVVQRAVALARSRKNWVSGGRLVQTHPQCLLAPMGAATAAAAIPAAAAGAAAAAA
eukprot:CAMPEP_0115673966 /NCGR_PEP_ID=MMETSP0272-20121206/53372_1 /TAXON_ID=71861 /ORGANISM="Scrippsiella trochoidea, Strain CCMP3099" /LENGTH=129 /DNA_ID=CAMNT_0003112849 /DNA_START=94 /DNA_END=481 /DNA_ORIENTATION=-